MMFDPSRIAPPEGGDEPKQREDGAAVMETEGSDNQASQRVLCTAVAAKSAKDRSMRDPRIDSVIALVAKTLEISEDELGPDSSIENTPLWGSMEHLDICLAFDKHLGRLSG